MRGRMACRLLFNGNEIIGGGADTGGNFTMDGSYDPATEAVAITKTYLKLTVIYKGKWDGTMIYGNSQIFGRGGFYDEGEFELWPEEEELGLEGLKQAESSFA
jgi:hypothetical protein